MKRLYLIIALILTIIGLQAQSITVENFRLLSNDLTANLEGTKRFDPNTRKNAALIKIETTHKGFVFEPGGLGLVGDPEYKVGEIWIYVPEGSKKITLKHETLGILRDFRYGEPILSGKTYLMKLSTGRVITHIEEDLGGNYLTFMITPQNAEILIDGKIFQTDEEGGVSTFLPYGTYQYEVSANMYKKAVGRITITSAEAIEENIELEPDYSILQINSNPSGATVYIDNVNAGTTPLTTNPVVSGEHTFQFRLPMYTTKTVTYNVLSGGGVCAINETLDVNFSTITITAPNQAEIYVNNERKGVGGWKGTLSAGTYLVEARKASHHSDKKTITVEGGKAQTVVLDSPVPRYGTLNIQSTPTKATIFVDGEELGTTPGIFKNILIGERNIILKREGYFDVSKIITIEEAKVLTEKFTLQKKESPQVETKQKTVEQKKQTKVVPIQAVTEQKPLKQNEPVRPTPEKTTPKENVPVQPKETTQPEKRETVYDGNMHNGHEFVDLGLSVKWATYNIGATTPEGYGSYFAWGETQTKNTYNWSTYKFCEGTSSTITKYCIDSNYGTIDERTQLEIYNDPAYLNWGGRWRMPTKKEVEELQDNCIWTWTVKNGVNGYNVTSIKNNNSIFLPAAGCIYDVNLENEGSFGFYWTRELDSSYSNSACTLYFSSSKEKVYYYRRYGGLTVRAVCE